MATNITAGNATNGLTLTPDNTGTLDIKTGTGAGTTAISIDASQNVAITGTLTVGGIPSGGNYILQNYTSPNTWDATAAKAAGLKAIRVTVVGAGGNGATAPTPAVNAAMASGGGGGAAIAYLPAASITPGNKTVTAGAGTNSFGPWGTATPFSPTATVSATAGESASGVPGGAGGAGLGGSINITGGGGGSGNAISGFYSGAGGSSILGGGGRSVGTAPATAGAPGGNYGGGGSGAFKSSAPGTAAAGGTGAPGIVIVEEFY